MTEPNILLPSDGASGVKADGTATATCLCGTVQLSFVSNLDMKLLYISLILIDNSLLKVKICSTHSSATAAIATNSVPPCFVQTSLSATRASSMSEAKTN